MKTKSLVVYHYLAHYRVPIFDHLCTDIPGASTEFYIAADKSSNISSLRVYSPESGSKISKRWKPLRNFWITKNILWQKGLIKLIFSRNYGSVIFLGNMYFLSTWVGCLFCKVFNIKIYMWTHGILREERGVKWAIRKSFYRLADGLFLYGGRAKQLLMDKGFSEDKLHVIYNSLDYYRQRKIVDHWRSSGICSFRGELNLPKNSRLIVYTGRVTKDKRLDKAIHILSEVVSAGKDYKLIIIGDGPELNNLRKMVFSLDLCSHVIIVGACYDEKLISKYIMSSDVMFIPGNVGLTAIHSLTYGTPVVTHNKLEQHKPEHEAIVEGFSGSFVDIDNIDKLVNSVEEWTEKKKNNFLSTSENCRSIIDKYYNPSFQRQTIESVLTR